MGRWLRFHTPNAGGQVGSLVRGLNPHAATENMYASTKDPVCHNQNLAQPN